MSVHLIGLWNPANTLLLASLFQVCHQYTITSVLQLTSIRHFSTETFLGAARVLASTYSTDTPHQAPLPKRIWFPRCGVSPSWRDGRGEIKFFILKHRNKINLLTTVRLLVPLSCFAFCFYWRCYPIYRPQSVRDHNSVRESRYNRSLWVATGRFQLFVYKLNTRLIRGGPFYRRWQWQMGQGKLSLNETIAFANILHSCDEDERSYSYCLRPTELLWSLPSECSQVAWYHWDLHWDITTGRCIHWPSSTLIQYRWASQLIFCSPSR